MHSLEVIVARNAEAAGREAGHAANDDDHERDLDITSNHLDECGRLADKDGVVYFSDSPIADAAFLNFNRARCEARQEG